MLTHICENPLGCN